MKLVKKEHLKEQYERYDLSIDGAYNNFVAEGVVVHNSNFGFITNDKGIDVHVFKRTSILPKASNENFNGHLKVFADNVMKIRKLLEIMLHEIKFGVPISDCENAPAKWTANVEDGKGWPIIRPEQFEQIQVYGEIAGGFYPHPDVERVEGAVKCQKGIAYAPYNFFYAFDIAVNGQIIHYDECQRLLTMANIFHAEPLFRGTFEEAINYNNEYQSTIPSRLGLPEIEDNICEGNVIRPVEPRYFGCGSRVILKNKNARWSEKIKVNAPKEVYKFTEVGQKLLEEALSLISENRLRNVLSKLGTITQKEFGRLMSEMNKDIFEELNKDFGEEFAALEKEERKMITKAVNKTTAETIRPHFQNILDNEF